MEDDEASWLRLGAQALSYRRDTLASNLKLLAVAQLLLSCSYALGPRSLPCGGLGLLCVSGSLLGLAAAHTCSRPLLHLHLWLSLATMTGTMLHLAKICRVLNADLVRISRALPGVPARHHSSHRLLLGFGAVTIALSLTSGLAALSSGRVLCLPAKWNSRGDEARGLLRPTQGLELIDLDLAVAPPLRLSEPDEYVYGPRAMPRRAGEPEVPLGSGHTRALQSAQCAPALRDR